MSANALHFHALSLFIDTVCLFHFLFASCTVLLIFFFLSNSMFTPLLFFFFFIYIYFSFLLKGYELSGEIALKNSHYYYWSQLQIMNEQANHFIFFPYSLL